MPQQSREPRAPAGPRRRLVIAVTILAMLGVGGCRSWRVSEVTPRQLIQGQTPSQVRVATTTDSTKLVLFQPTIIGDSLRGLPTELAVRPRMIALAQITEIATKHFNPGKTLLTVAAIATAVVAYDLLMSLNQTSP